MIVDLHFFVDWGDLCLYGALVGCVYDSEVALGASVGRVHDEEKERGIDRQTEIMCEKEREI